MSKESLIVSDEVIINKIYLIRGRKVMLDRDLAELYGVETRRLKEQVRRNISRFPEDFMFELSKQELEDWRSQYATSSREKKGLRIAPFVFTEHGAVMLASVLNSDRAINVNVQIIRLFNKMREVLMANDSLLLKLNEVEKRLSEHDESIDVVMNYLRKFVQDQKQPRKEVGFKSNKKK